jgi:hypothetical protein
MIIDFTIIYKSILIANIILIPAWIIGYLLDYLDYTLISFKIKKLVFLKSYFKEYGLLLIFSNIICFLWILFLMYLKFLLNNWGV